MSLIIFLFVYFYLRIVSGGDNCPDTPLLIVFNSTTNRTEFLSPSTSEDGDQFLYFQEPITLYFKCRANQPIEIEVEALMAEIVEDVVFSRELKNLFDSESYCYVATFFGNPNYRVTGKYVCSVIGDKQRSSSIFIFADSDRGSILLNNGTQQLIKGFPDDDGWITIPCVATNPNAIPTISKLSLLRNLKQSPMLRLEKGSVEYSIGRGYRIKATSPQCCSKEYICDLRLDSNSDADSPTYTTVLLYKTEAISEKVFFRVSPSDYVLGFNPEVETKLRLPILSETRISCESNVKVDLEVQNAETTEQGRYRATFETNENSFYQQKATLMFKTSKVGVIAIFCRTEKSRQPLHKWEITTVINSEYQASPGIYFLKNKRYPIACFSSNGERPSISIIQCDDDISCRIAESKSYLMLKEDSVGKDVFPFDLIPGHPFCVKDRQAANALACAEVSPYLGSKRGIVKCREVQPDRNYIVYTENFLIGLNNSIVLLPKDPFEEAGKNADDSAVLQMDPTKTVLYVDEEVSVRCNASYGVFSLGIQIMFQLQNNTNLTSLDFGRLNFKEDLNNHVITFEGAVKIEAAQIQRIWCFAPIWNSPNWRSVSREVTIKVGLPPFIWHSSENETRDFGLGEIGYNLSCEFGGDPFPTIRWTKDKDELSEKNTKVMSIKTLGNSSWLQLSPIVEAHVGVYTCEAKNVKGKAFKSYIVKITNSGMFEFYLYLGAAVAVVLFAIVIVFVLILRNRKNTDEKLTELEIHEFTFGNQNLASKFAELNENARYLPYKQDFEIPKAKLELKEDEVLGAGAFGMVIKGYLTRHSERIPVAIKTVRSNVDITQLRNLLSEIKILMYIGQHPNIIGLLGAITRELREGKLHVVVEYCAHGNLLTFLREARPTFVNQITTGGKLDFRKTSSASTRLRPGSNLSTKSWKIDDFLPESRKTLERRNSTSPVKTQDLITWAMQIADGMIYLGTKNVIHGDLATRNLLLTKNYTVKITDFGLSTHLYDYTNYIKRQKDEPVPWRWLSVEAIRDSKFSVATDVWAYGVTLWEIFSLAEVPYQGFSWGTEFVDKLFAGLRLTLPQYANEEIFWQMEKCWEQDPIDRTPFKDSRDFFSSILHSSTSK